MPDALRQEALLRRFWEKVVPIESGCWQWIGALVKPSRKSNGHGYGLFQSLVRLEMAHKFAYEQFVGPVPDGKELDHVCRNRACVNPAHLEAVSHRENLLRSPVTQASINLQKTHCKHGHPLSGDNLYTFNFRGRVHRACRVCRAAASARRYQKVTGG